MTRKTAPVKKAAKKKPAAKKAAPAASRAKAKSDGLKTKPTSASVAAFIARIPNEARRKDALTALALMKKATGEEPKMWGPSIIGFGSYHYRYESGHEGDMCIAGFSPRTGATVFYVMGDAPQMHALYGKLGKHRTGKACLYVNRLADVDLKVLERIIKNSVAYMRKKYPAKP